MTPRSSLFLDAVRFVAALLVMLSHLTSHNVNAVFPWVRWAHEAVVVCNAAGPGADFMRLFLGDIPRLPADSLVAALFAAMVFSVQGPLPAAPWQTTVAALVRYLVESGKPPPAASSWPVC